jgi:hypothetical protein
MCVSYNDALLRGEQGYVYLRPSVEREPDCRSSALLFLGVPLGREERETGCYGGFEDT